MTDLEKSTTQNRKILIISYATDKTKFSYYDILIFYKCLNYFHFLSIIIKLKIKYENPETFLCILKF